MTYTPAQKIISIFLSVILCFAISGCASAKKHTPTQLSEDILELTSFSELKELSGASLPSYFVFQDGSVKRFSVRVSATAQSSDTLACFEVADEKQRATAVSGISQYLTNLSTAFKSTMEQEYQKVENRLLVELESIIILVICNDSTAVWDYLTRLGAKEVI